MAFPEPKYVEVLLGPPERFDIIPSRGPHFAIPGWFLGADGVDIDAAEMKTRPIEVRSPGLVNDRDPETQPRFRVGVFLAVSGAYLVAVASACPDELRRKLELPDNSFFIIRSATFCSLLDLIEQKVRPGAYLDSVKRALNVAAQTCPWADEQVATIAA